MERVESIIEEKEGVRGVLRVGGPVPTNVGRGLSADGSSPFSLDMIPQLTVVHRWELQRWLPRLAAPYRRKSCCLQQLHPLQPVHVDLSIA